MKQELKSACKGCGGDLVVKVNRLTQHKFLGCVNFPDCRNTQPLKEKEEPDSQLNFLQSLDLPTETNTQSKGA